MSCGEVQMYQAYYPYLYQRAAAAGAGPGASGVPPAAHHRHHAAHHAAAAAGSAATASHAPPFGSPTATASPFVPATAHQYDRFNVQRSLTDNPQPSTSSLPLPGELYLHSPHLSSASAVVSSSLHHHAGLGGHSASTSHSSGGSPGVSGAGGTVSGVSPASSPIRSVPGGTGSLLTHKVEEDVSLHGRSSTEAIGGGGDDDDDDSCGGGGASCVSRAQYVSANCVVFTHYTGDAASVVDEHFSRALDKNSPSTSGKETSPMSARNFPASFWNSHYQHPVHVHAHSTADLYDAYHHHAATAPDPWHAHYQQYTAAAAHHHRAVHDYHHAHHAAAAHHAGSAAAAMAHQAAAYGGLLLPPPAASRLSHHMAAATQCKATPADWQHHQGAAATHLDTAAYYPTMAGLEAQVQETSKDLYWF